VESGRECYPKAGRCPRNQENDVGAVARVEGGTSPLLRRLSAKLMTSQPARRRTGKVFRNLNKLNRCTSDAIVIELVHADETPAVVIVRRPAKPTIFHPRRFPSGADAAAVYWPPRSSSWRRSEGAATVKPSQCQVAQRGER
jgi:hypothetical protein